MTDRDLLTAIRDTLARQSEEISALRREVAALTRSDDGFAVPGDPLPPATDHGGYVYFARCCHGDGHVKIGYAKDLANRLGSLRNGCPYKIHFVAWYWVEDPEAHEADLHNRFAESRLRRRGEWFGSTPELEDLIRLIREQRRASINALAGGAP